MLTKNQLKSEMGWYEVAFVEVPSVLKPRYDELKILTKD